MRPGPEALREVNAALARAFPEADLRAQRGLSQGETAQVFDATDAGRRVIVKRFTSRDRLEHVDMLKATHDRAAPLLASGPCRLARCLRLSRAEALAVMMHAPGLRLDHALPAMGDAARAEALALAGRWLAQLYGADRQDAAVNLHRRIRLRKETLTEAALPLADARLVDAAFVELRALARSMAGRPLATAPLHGDFAPQNLHLDGAVLWGFDLERRARRAVALDTGRFLALIALRTPSMGRPLRHGVAEADLAAFLTGGAFSDGPDLAFFIGDEFLRTLIEGRDDPLRLTRARKALTLWLEGAG